MIHVAIMKKSWGLTEKILTGEKKVESRWYKVKYAPWNRIKPGEIVYFKNGGESVKIKSIVDKVLQFEDLTPKKVQEILKEYGKEDGIAEDKISEFYELFKDKKYCMLIFLKDVEEIEPFEIDKRGFGSMAAWLSCNEIPIKRVR